MTMTETEGFGPDDTARKLTEALDTAESACSCGVVHQASPSPPDLAASAATTIRALTGRLQELHRDLRVILLTDEGGPPGEEYEQARRRLASWIAECPVGECDGYGLVWTDPHECTCGGYGPPYYMHEPYCGAEPCSLCKFVPREAREIAP